MPAPAGVQPGAEQPSQPGSEAASPAVPTDAAQTSATPRVTPDRAGAPGSAGEVVEADVVDGGGGDAAPDGEAEAAPRRGNRFLRVLKVIAIVIALPVLALLIGLLVAWIVHVARGGDEARTGNTTVSPTPSASASAAPSSGPSASTAPSSGAPSAAPAITVPSSWVTEPEPPPGVSFRYPDGWIRRTSGSAVFRFAPTSPGATAPGVEGIGVQVAAAGVTPDAAIRQFVGSNYGSQPGYSAGAPAAVPANTPGKHDGELRSIVRYTRSGVAVVVVVDSYTVATPSGNRSVVVLGRAANTNPTRAAQLQAFVETSLKAG